MVVVVAQCYVGCNSTSDADKRNKTAEETKKKLDRGMVAETPCWRELSGRDGARL